MPIASLKYQRRRGAILLNVLIFMIVISIIIAGMALLMVSDNSVGRVESNYSNSLAVAEAGVNYELCKISNDARSADQKQLLGTPGIAYATTSGTFAVYVTQRNSDGSETTPWVPGQNLWIYSTGGVGNLKRTVKVAASPDSTTPGSNYAVFGVGSGTVIGSSAVVTGDMVTDGTFFFNGHPTVNGNIVFNGPTSDWLSLPSGTYPVIRNPSPVTWPTVEALAVTAFGVQGLSYVATHNDNALAGAGISNNVVSTSGNNGMTFYGKPGGANYYLTSLNCGGSAPVLFDNRTGPITIWVGPSGASSTFQLKGGTASIKMTADPTKPVRVNIATINDVVINGSLELDAGIYNVNNAGKGNVVFSGSSQAIYGMIICNTFSFNGSPNIGAVPGYFSPSSTVSGYGCVQPWQEIGGVN